LLTTHQKWLKRESQPVNLLSMPLNLSRRSFVKTSLLGIGAISTFATQAVEPFNRAGGARLRLSLAAYSFRQYFKDGERGQTKPVPMEKQMDMLRFVDYCADHGCDGAEVTSYYFPKDLTTEYLLKLKRHAFLRGIEISGTAVGNTFTPPPGDKRTKEIESMKRWIDYAAVLGAPHIRVFAGSLDNQTLDAAKKNCIEALSECAEYAGQKGIFLGVENHGGIVAEPEPLLDIVKSVQSPWVGINLDTGNFRTNDPYKDVARCAPYAVNVQIKTEVAPRGQKSQPADLKRLAQILRDAQYQGYAALEYESEEDPFTAVPRALAELQQNFRG
jgi:sugar phosphate isomerase/epimerase